MLSPSVCADGMGINWMHYPLKGLLSL